MKYLIVNPFLYLTLILIVLVVGGVVPFMAPMLSALFMLLFHASIVGCENE